MGRNAIKIIVFVLVNIALSLIIPIATTRGEIVEHINDGAAQFVYFSFALSVFQILVLISLMVVMMPQFIKKAITSQNTSDYAALLILVFAVVTFVNIFTASVIMGGNYVLAFAMRPNIAVENATIYVAPAGSGFNITAVVTIRNNEAYPVNVTGVFVDLGEVCRRILVGAYRCYTQLDSPVVTVEPNSSVTIVAHRLYDKTIAAANNQMMTAITVVRADVPQSVPLLIYLKPVEHAVFAAAQVRSS